MLTHANLSLYHCLFSYPLQEELSDASRVLLRGLTLNSTGLYRCEVSAEAPNFSSVQGEGRMDIVCKYPAEFRSNLFKVTFRICLPDFIIYVAPRKHTNEQMFARKISHQLQANIGSVNTGQIQGVRWLGLNLDLSPYWHQTVGTCLLICSQCRGIPNVNSIHGSVHIFLIHSTRNFNKRLQNHRLKC